LLEFQTTSRVALIRRERDRPDSQKAPGIGRKRSTLYDGDRRNHSNQWHPELDVNAEKFRAPGKAGATRPVPCCPLTRNINFYAPLFRHEGKIGSKHEGTQSRLMFRHRPRLRGHEGALCEPNRYKQDEIALRQVHAPRSIRDLARRRAGCQTSNRCSPR
jgi:hypothetical protein